jgi:5-carboxymethyl-2-hydroxymuconate isomerase
MPDFEVDPEYLKVLAKAQDDASKKAGQAATAAEKITTDVWVSHGVISCRSNIAATRAEDSRRKAGEALVDVLNDLAAKLRTADDAYRTIDEEMADNLSKQVVDR